MGKLRVNHKVLLKGLADALARPLWETEATHKGHLQVLMFCGGLFVVPLVFYTLFYDPRLIDTVAAFFLQENTGSTLFCGKQI